MLEILVLIALGKNMVRVARTKKRSGTAFVFLLLACWFGGEFGGGFAAAVVQVVATGREPSMGLVYIFALIGAVAGAFLAGQIAKSIPPKRPTWHDDEEDDEAGEPPPRQRQGQAGEFYDPERQAHRPPPGTEFRAGDE